METKNCPYCGEEILATAKKCKHCGEWLTEETASVPRTEPQEKRMIICPCCAEEIEEGTTVCPYCHETLSKEEKPKMEKTPERKDEAYPPVAPPSLSVAQKAPVSKFKRGFFAYYFVDVFFRHYADFKGKISRKQFWMAYLCYNIFMYALLLLDYAIGSPYIISSLAFLATTVPAIAYAVRRLHDTGKSGWWMLIGLVPIVGTILFFVFLCKKGETVAEKTKHGLADIITWVVVVLIYVLALILAPAGISIEGRMPLYPTTGEVVTLYTSEYLTEVSESERTDEQISSDGKYMFYIKTDLIDDEEYYFICSWLCVRSLGKDGLEIPLLLVGDGEGLRFLDYTVFPTGRIILHLLEGQDLVVKQEIVYDFLSHQIVYVEEEEYDGGE